MIKNIDKKKPYAHTAKIVVRLLKNSNPLFDNHSELIWSLLNNKTGKPHRYLLFQNSLWSENESESIKDTWC